MTLALALWLSFPAAATAEEDAGILHRPENELRTGHGRLRFRVLGPDRAGAIVVRWRANAGAPGEVRAARNVGGWIAELPEDVVQPPGFAYWAVERMPDGTERPLFASADDPHPVQVFDSETDARRRERLDGLRGRRSETAAVAEYVDFGGRRVPAYGGDAVPDHYYRLEARFAYAILGAADRIEIAVGHLRGEAAQLTTPDPSFRVGTDYGQAAITWSLAPIVRIRTAILFGISQDGFEQGGGADLVLGLPWWTSFTIGAEAVTTLGYTARLRLGWATVPRVPMGASIELTNYPAGEDTGVRLLADVGVEISDAWRLSAEGGYQGRTAVTGGPTAGVELALRF